MVPPQPVPLQRAPLQPPPPVALRGRWMQVLSHIDPAYGGLSSSVPPLGAALTIHGLEIAVAAFCNSGERFLPADLEVDQVSFWPAGRRSWLNPQIRNAFRRAVGECDGVHIHGLWEQSTAQAAATARALGVPYILSAHGMLEPWALAQGRLKKLVYATLIERKNVAQAACLHALTHAEAQQYRNFGARNPIAVIPNAVSIPFVKQADFFLRRFPQLLHRRIVLFLGRLHTKKGLDLLVDSWAQLSSRWPEAVLVLAGPDADGTGKRLEGEVVKRGLGESVVFTGMLDAESKWSALAAAEGFILPSFSEGLSVGVLEAMGMGVPVIVSEGCNMPEVQSNGAGWIVKPEQGSVTSALREFLENSAVTNHDIGLCGAKLIRARYSWTTIGTQMSDLYAWLQGGAKPVSFELNQL